MPYPWDILVYLDASSVFQVVRILREYAFLWVYADLYAYILVQVSIYHRKNKEMQNSLRILTT